MNVAILTDTHLWGGLETHAAALAESLTAAGHTVTILCLDGRACPLFRQAVPESIAVVELRRPVRPSFLGWWRSLRGVKADGLLLEKGTLHTGGFALDCALRFLFPRYVTYQQLEPPPLPPKTSRTYLGGLIPGLGLWWYRFRFSGWLRSLAPRATICVSDAARHALARDYGFSEQKLITIRHGIDVKQFRSDAHLRAAARASWSIGPNAFVFGTARRFVAEKGLDVLIRAFAALRSSTDRDVRLVLIGEGPEQGTLETLTRSLGVADSVLFAGFTPKPWTIYPGFDVFVIPSRIEALGVVVLEAMASGCVVIGSRVGGIPEMITDPSLGFLVQPGDVGELAGAMADVLAMNPGEFRRRAEHAQKHVADEFDLMRQSMKIAALLDRDEPKPARRDRG